MAPPPPPRPPPPPPAPPPPPPPPRPPRRRALAQQKLRPRLGNGAAEVVARGWPCGIEDLWVRRSGRVDCMGRCCGSGTEPSYIPNEGGCRKGGGDLGCGGGPSNRGRPAPPGGASRAHSTAHPAAARQPSRPPSLSGRQPRDGQAVQPQRCGSGALSWALNPRPPSVFAAGRGGRLTGRLMATSAPPRGFRVSRLGARQPQPPRARVRRLAAARLTPRGREAADGLQRTAAMAVPCVR